ncbi:MAG: hypothetical protein ACLUKN_06550 [Bacilli bacterium]
MPCKFNEFYGTRRRVVTFSSDSIGGEMGIDPFYNITTPSSANMTTAKKSSPDSKEYRLPTQ